MQSKNSNHIDGHKIVKAFGDDLTKMVFLVETTTGEKVVLKVYTLAECNAFELEVEANMRLSELHTRVVKMQDFVGYETPKAPFVK